MPDPFYQTSQGLRFACTRCGTCCTRPGPVYFPEADLKRAATFLSLTPQGFVQKFKLVKIEGIRALDPPEGEPCPFYDDARGCTIYPARPVQCRTWPFWPELVKRKRAWEAAAKECPGMNRGRRHTPQEIEKSVQTCNAAMPEGEPWA